MSETKAGDLTEKKTLNTKHRNIQIDIIRGIAIFLVLWGHFIQYTSTDTFDYFNNWVFKFIYSFHMPLFVLISGFLFYASSQKRNLKELIYARIKGVLIPLVIWSTINYLLSCVEKRSINILGWIDVFTGNYLWFLWSILGASICLALIIKLVPSKFQLVAIIVGFFGMNLFPNPEMNLYVYPFFIIGYYVNKHKEMLKQYIYIYTKYGVTAILSFIILLCFFKKECFIYTTGVTIWNRKIGILQHVFVDIYRYIIGLVGSVSIIFIVKKLNAKIPEFIKDFFISCGQYSMQIYILQSITFKIYTVILKKIVGYLGFNIFSKNMLFYNFLFTPIFSIVTIVIILIIAKTIEKNKTVSKILFGR